MNAILDRMLAPAAGLSPGALAVARHRARRAGIEVGETGSLGAAVRLALALALALELSRRFRLTQVAAAAMAARIGDDVIERAQRRAVFVALGPWGCEVVSSPAALPAAPGVARIVLPLSEIVAGLLNALGGAPR